MFWVVVIATAVVLADQLTKWLVRHGICETQPVPILSGLFQLVNWRNSGAAWGILRDHNWILVIASLLTLLGLVVFRRSLQLQRRWNRVAIGLMAGGIVGNLIDRVCLGFVVDFLDFSVAGHHWPAFNIADSAICIGVVLYIIGSWRDGRSPEGTSPACGA